MATITRASNLSAAEYFAAPGLSQSGMKDLAISPLRFWYHHVNPDRPKDEPTPQMILGSALHCAVLEPVEFESRYACDIRAQDYPGCLVTMDDLRKWLGERGLPTSGKTKLELVNRVTAADPAAIVYDVLKEQFDKDNGGRTVLNRIDMDRVMNAAAALRNEPSLQPILADGEPEVMMTAVDPDTGVILKARMDWVTPTVTLDPKTFSQMRSKSIDKSIADAIFYEAYYRQAYFYTYIRSFQPDALQRPPDFVLAFVESDEPHEVRIKVLRSMAGGQVNLYWHRAHLECQALIQMYAEYSARFGVEPWRDDRSLDILIDEEIPQLAW